MSGIRGYRDMGWNRGVIGIWSGIEGLWGWNKGSIVYRSVHNACPHFMD